MSPFFIGSFAAFLIGLSKTGVPGVGLASVVLMVYAFPGMEKNSTGAVLPLLILADCFAVFYHNKNIQWNKLRQLFPPVLLGLILGSFVLVRISNTQFPTLLGSMILLLLALEFLRKRMQWNSVPHHPAFAWFMGGATGFTTLVGNAAGPVMSIYMAAQNLSKDKFMGTWAWFFFCMNWSKVPFMCGLIFPDLKMITLETLWFDLQLIPAIVVGAVLGKRVYALIPEKYFAKLVLLLNVIPPICMVLRF
ncbi:MAG: sulfite exporter TauE/SafE family protein [Planctomycetaceae bacterium]|nr:sulfite exporter TauE/SafE family protein [Planctomycetaceae bacterium]